MPIEEDKKPKEPKKKSPTLKPIKIKKEEKPIVIKPVPIKPPATSTNVTDEFYPLQKIPYVVPSCA